MFKLVLRFTLPMLALSAIAVGFLRARRFRPLGPAVHYTLAGVAALPLLASGTVHLLRPGLFVPLLPPWVPGRLAVIWLTGLPELAGAVGLFVPGWRKPAAAWLAMFMIAIFPANLYVAGEQVQGMAMPGVPVRTAMQAVYIALLLTVGYGLPRYASAHLED